MELLKPTLGASWKSLKNHYITAGLASVLLLTSCGEITPKDVYEQTRKIENIELKKEVFKEGYRNATNEYNRLLIVRDSIKSSKKLSEEEKKENLLSLDLLIQKRFDSVEYNGNKIEELSGEKVEEEKNKVDMEAKCSDYYHPDWNYVNPNKYDKY